MTDKLVPPANVSARPKEALANFVPNKSVLFMESWRKDRALTGGKFAVKEPSQFTPDAPAAFTIINHDRDGKERIDLSRTRYDRTERKYEYPYGVPLSAYAPEKDSYAKFRDSKSKWIAEGEGKAIALSQLGLPVLGIGGCECWHTSKSSELLPDFAEIKAGDKVYIAGDGDVRTNLGVRSGFEKLMFAIRQRGAVPYYVMVPEDAGAKAGIDDVIARWLAEGKDVAKELDGLRKVTDLKVLDDFTFATYDDLLTRPFPEWIVDGLVQPGELTAIVGETSCGKSFLVQDLMSSVARGLSKWFGKDINAKGLVVHINFEGRGLSTRMKAYAQHHGTKSFPYLALEQSIILPDDNDTDRFIRSVKNASLKYGLPVVIVAVDTVNRALGGGDENSSADMGAFIRAADKIRDAFPKAGILLVHHTGKDKSKGARGHSSFSAAVGGELYIEDNNGTRTVTITKQRDWTTDTKFHFKLDVVTLGQNGKGVDITSCVVMPTADAPVTELTDTRVYGQMHLWYLTENNNKLTSYEQLRRNKGRILKDMKMNMTDFMGVVEWAISQGLITKTKLDRPGYSLELHAPKPSKY